MAKGFKVWTDFRVRRNDVNKALKGLKGQMRGLNKAASSAMGPFKAILGARAVTMGLGLASQGVRTVVGDFVELDQAVTSAGARFGDMFDQGTKGFDRLSDAARQIGAETEFRSKEAGEGLTFLAMAGFDAEKSMKLLPTITDLATASNLDFARSTDIATDSLGAFDRAGGTAEEVGKNFQEIMDQAARATNTSNQNLEAWFEAVVSGAPAVVSAGQTMETFNASLGILANSGIKGSAAGVRLRNMMLNLAGPTPRATKLLKKLNVEVDDGSGKFKSFGDILIDLKKGLSGLGEVKRTAVLKDIFGKRQVSAVNVLLNAGGKAVNDYSKEIKNSGGAAAKLANKMRNSIGNRVKKLQSMAVELGFKLIDAFGKDSLQSAMASLGTWLEGANSGFGKFVDLIAEVKDVFIEWQPWIEAVVVSLVTYFGLVKGIWLLTKLWAGAMMLLNIVMGLNPLGAMILGIVIATGLIFRYKEEIRSLGHEMKVFGRMMLSVLIEPLANFLELLGDIPGFEELGMKSAELRKKQEHLERLDDPRFARGAAPLVKMPTKSVLGKDVSTKPKDTVTGIPQAFQLENLDSLLSGGGGIKKTENVTKIIEQFTQTVDFANVPDFVNIGVPELFKNKAGAMP